ncbi:uncharacterized protein PV09_04393 [Verruconis gallopava]|uniref:Delta 8-(E)-sphingolipid desaturase n=1 Tax=Verruconis gallopava TaxID=253628 RepID=A0A0D2ACM3_9PEZI|nr:uncharacterized protein PV09_04393 [Verruconis gallopava]KIW04648.1 hypothetical protein PV09_04393 [Verruconis gallopava]
MKPLIPQNRTGAVVRPGTILGQEQSIDRESEKKLLDITIEEVEAANTSKKPWVAIRGKVYDLTAFLNKHPGGSDFLLASIGRDATAIKYLIGNLKGATNMLEYRKESAFYNDVKKRIAALFREIGIDPREAPGMTLRYLFVSAVFLAMYVSMFSKPTAWTRAWIPWLCAIITGWAGAMMGFLFLHNGCHANFTKSPKVWNVLRRLYESFTGLITLVWFYQHGLEHHPYTNIVGADPDIISDDPGLLRVHDQLILSRKLTEYKQVFVDRKYKHIKINPPRLRNMFGQLLFWLLALHTVSDLFWSIYLTLIFQASHVNNEVAWPNPSNANVEDWKQSDWAALQIESSLDFAHGDFWTTFMCGSLNYQAVHHLFPYISQYYYPEMAPIVRDVCAEYGVGYNLKDNI